MNTKRKPFIIHDFFNQGNPITIDLFDVDQIVVPKGYYDEENCEDIDLPDDVCCFQMKDNKEYYSRLTVEEALFVSAMMYKSKMKDAVKSIFYGIW